VDINRRIHISHQADHLAQGYDHLLVMNNILWQSAGFTLPSLWQLLQLALKRFVWPYLAYRVDSHIFLKCA
jgi:hypothetical protein